MGSLPFVEPAALEEAMAETIAYISTLHGLPFWPVELIAILSATETLLLAAASLPLSGAFR